MVETRRSSAAAAAGKRCPTPPSPTSVVSPSAKRSKVEAGSPAPREKEPVDLEEPSLAAQDDGVVAKSTSPDISLTVEMEVDGPIGLSGQGHVECSPELDLPTKYKGEEGPPRTVAWGKLVSQFSEVVRIATIIFLIILIIEVLLLIV